jgi:hypothetical protein
MMLVTIASGFRSVIVHSTARPKTKLAGIAVKRAQRVIDRKLKEVEPPP